MYVIWSNRISINCFTLHEACVILCNTLPDHISQNTLQPIAMFYILRRTESCRRVFFLRLMHCWLVLFVLNLTHHQRDSFTLQLQRSSDLHEGPIGHSNKSLGHYKTDALTVSPLHCPAYVIRNAAVLFHRQRSEERPELIKSMPIYTPRPH